MFINWCEQHQRHPLRPQLYPHTHSKVMSFPVTATSSPSPAADSRLQIFCLSVLIKACIEVFRQHDSILSTSTDTGAQVSSSDLELCLGKFAQIIDSKKGGDTISSLICLKSSDSNPEYILCSNNRSDAELESTVTYLSDLLQYIATNPERLGTKPMKKRIRKRPVLSGRGYANLN